MKISEKLLYIRAKLNMSQEKLAQALGVSFATVNRWELEKTRPSSRYEVLIDSFAEEHGVKFKKRG